LLTAVLARQAAAAVGVRTCWPWETAATLPSARRRKALRRQRGEERGGAYRGGRPPTACSCMQQQSVPLLPMWRFIIEYNVVQHFCVAHVTFLIRSLFVVKCYLFYRAILQYA